MSNLNIFNRLLEGIGSVTGACALMGNLKAESAMRSNNLQNSGNTRLGMTDEEYTEAVDDGIYTLFGSDNRGYGLAQWTSSGRKTALLNFAQSAGKSIGDEDMQIDYLLYELNHSYKNVMKVLQSDVSLSEKSDYVVKKFERPANQSESVLAKRACNGMDFYSEFMEVDRMIKPMDYKQGDSRWGTNSYAVDGESSTIKSAGCGPTAMANVLASIVSPHIDPLTCASWARMKNYKVYKSGTSYSFPEAIGKAYGVKVRRLNTSNIYGNRTSMAHAQALTELQAGNWLIACMGKGIWTSSGHYITVYGYVAGDIYINDPASSAANRACNKWDTFISQVKFYWVVEVPEEIKKGGKPQGGYDLTEFVRECQMCLRAGIDGKAGPQTLGKTVTVSKTKNRKHNVVLPMQKLLKKLGYYDGALDRIAGNGFDAALKKYQKEIRKMKNPDGEATAKGGTWVSMLGL